MISIGSDGPVKARSLLAKVLDSAPHRKVWVQNVLSQAWTATQSASNLPL